MAHHSSTFYPNRMTIERLEGFLVGLANLDRLENYDGARDFNQLQHFVKSYSEFFPASFPTDSHFARFQDEEHAKIDATGVWQAPRTQDERERDSLLLLLDWRNRLRKAWDEPDPHQREWTVFALRLKFHEETSPGTVPPAPERTPFEQAMVHFLQRARERRLKHCPAENCQGFTYFIAKNPRYVFCSEECIRWRQQQLNNDWWREKGKKKRQSKSKKGARR